MLSLRKNPTLYKGHYRSGNPRSDSGVTDPNPQVAGKGIRILKESGIKVQVGVLEEEVRRQNEAFSSISELNCHLSH